MDSRSYNKFMLISLLLLIIGRIILSYFNISWMKTVSGYDFIRIVILFVNCGVHFAREFID